MGHVGNQSLELMDSHYFSGEAINGGLLAQQPPWWSARTVTAYLSLTAQSCCIELLLGMFSVVCKMKD